MYLQGLCPFLVQSSFFGRKASALCKGFIGAPIVPNGAPIFCLLSQVQSDWFVGVCMSRIIYVIARLEQMDSVISPGRRFVVLAPAALQDEGQEKPEVVICIAEGRLDRP